MTRLLLACMMLTVFLVSVSTPPASAATIQCAECGMMVMTDSKFSAKVVQAGTTLYFCDIGDLFSYLKRKSLNESSIEVKDYPSGATMDARKAYYVLDAKKFRTPMGWGVASFLDKQEASKAGTPLDFESMAKALK